MKQVTKVVRTDAGARRSLRSAIRSLEQAEHSLTLLRGDDEGKYLLVVVQAVRRLAQGFAPVSDESGWLAEYFSEVRERLVADAHSVHCYADCHERRAEEEAEERREAEEHARANPWEAACAPEPTWEALDLRQELLAGASIYTPKRRSA